MILVDSTVWIDYFNGVQTPHTDLVDGLLGQEPLLTGDLILAEVLQGFRRDGDYRTARSLLARLECAPMVGRDVALRSAEGYRNLRKRGVTVRRTIDMLIGTFCILHDHCLVHSDRDFDPIEEHLGLRVLHP
jgi:predicted nucleic acid-binding protein